MAARTRVPPVTGPPERSAPHQAGAVLRRPAGAARGRATAIAAAALAKLAPHPDVRLGGEPFRAQVITDQAERRRLWALADAVFPAFAAYRGSAARHGREIPVIQLTAR